MAENIKKNVSQNGVIKNKPNGSRAVAKKLTPEETRVHLRKFLQAECDPVGIIQSAAKRIEALDVADKKESKEIIEAIQKDGYKCLMALGVETNYALAETVGDRYRPLAIAAARQVEKEYDCKTPTEKMLAETIAGSYLRIINYSRKLNGLTDESRLNSERNGYGGMLSKEIDRAQRHFLSALITLKQIKNPPLELNVMARTAFVAQNQQINADGNATKRNEIVEAK